MVRTPSNAGRPRDGAVRVVVAAGPGSGVAAWGRGFYVWAEDEAELRDWVRVLDPEPRALRTRPSRRPGA